MDKKKINFLKIVFECVFSKQDAEQAIMTTFGQETSLNDDMMSLEAPHFDLKMAHLDSTCKQYLVSYKESRRGCDCDMMGAKRAFPPEYIPGTVQIRTND